MMTLRPVLCISKFYFIYCFFVCCCQLCLNLQYGLFYYILIFFTLYYYAILTCQSIWKMIEHIVRPPYSVNVSPQTWTCKFVVVVCCCVLYLFFIFLQLFDVYEPLQGFLAYMFFTFMRGSFPAYFAGWVLVAVKARTMNLSW